MKITTCQNCHQKPIEITYQQVINNQREDLYLCFHCAQQLGINQRLPDFAKNLMQEMFGNEIFEDSIPFPVTTSKDKASESIQKQSPQPKKVEIDVHESKILALTLDKEQALATENYAEVARITKILEELQKEKGK